MGVTEALQPYVHDPAFWAALLTPSAYDIAVRVSLPVAGGYGLVLDLHGGDQALGLREPHAHEPTQLAWAGPGRPHPPTLRFAELELVGRVIAWDDPTLPHPGLPVALLSGFARADGPVARATLEAAYRSLRRPVPAAVEVRPEQDPLPLFVADRWWPQPPRPSDQVLSEGEIASLLEQAPAGPVASQPELVRRAARRLAAVPDEPWCSPDVAAAARRLVAAGDVAAAPDVLAAIQAAGCDHPVALDAFTEPVVPTEACWVAETLAGVTPGTALRRWLDLRTITPDR